MRRPRDRARQSGVPFRRVVILVVGLAAFGGVGWALTLKKQTTRDYAPFKQCPLANHATNLCLFTQTERGEFIVGEKTVPISGTITLQGGVHVVESKEKESVRDIFIGTEDGKTVSKTPQAVPGGLSGVVNPELLSTGMRKVFNEFLKMGDTTVTATIELAEPPSSIRIDVQNLIEGQGIALVLPVKVKLDNGFLGGSCYIGSSRRPVSLSLTTGNTSPPKPNKPIRGRVGKASLKDDYSLTVVRGTSLVSDSFAAPGAEGCGGAARGVDRAVNAELGLPAPAGHNTAILNGTLREANAPAVRMSE